MRLVKIDFYHEIDFGQKNQGKSVISQHPADLLVNWNNRFQNLQKKIESLLQMIFFFSFCDVVSKN